MATYLPQSFRKLVLIGFILMAIPLLVATGVVYQAIGQADTSRREAVSRFVLVARNGREIETTLGAMKQAIMHLPAPAARAARATPAFRDLTGQFAGQLRAFANLPSMAEQRSAIGRLIERATILNEDFRVGGDNSLLAGQIHQIDEETRRILHDGEQAMERGIEQVDGQAASLRAVLLATVLAALLTATLVLLVLRRVITGQIRRMDRVIRDIGRTDFVPDITVVGIPDFSDLTRRLDWLRRRLRNTEAQRTRFLRHVSHDLKTPLTAICEGAQLLSEGAAGPLDPHQKPLVDIVNKNAHRLQKFIEDMLNYQQISSARVNLEPRAMRMDKLCEAVLGAHIMAIGKRNLRIKRSLPEVELKGDWNKLYAVLDNLVSNAIKFSPEDGVVTVDLVDAGGEVVVNVVDQGKGVPDEERKRIFEPFFRGTRAAQGEVKGSGLGLAIARDYARAHRGRLELIDSEQGAHFRFTLPKKRSNAVME